MEQPKAIDQKYWDSEKERWNSHAAFDTIDHSHISHYGDKNCDIMVVKCRDGRSYIEDNWGGDAPGYPEVFQPYEKSSVPTMMTWNAAISRAKEIVAEVCQVPVEKVSGI